jgi:3-phenylpropionate/cinnamic acid dioxygenase small subunit
VHSPDLFLRVSLFNAAYSRCIDNDELEAWPDFFADPCSYTITSDDNYSRGLPAGIIFCDSQAMMQDRVSALREANIYERQRYRHLLGMPTAVERTPDGIKAETPLAVYRIMRDGSTDLFVTGRYVDTLREREGGELKLAERTVVCDSSTFDTLVAIPL